MSSVSDRDPTVAGAILRQAIRYVFEPDPWLDQADQDTIEAVALAVEGMAEVSRRRRESLGPEPWKTKTPARHLEHATIHVDTAFAAAEEGLPVAVDEETGLPHLLHCVLRCAFAHARQQGVGGPP